MRKPHLSQLASTLSWTAFGQARRKVRIPGLGCASMLFETDAAVESYSRAAFNLLSLDANPTDVVFLGVVGLRPDAVEW